MKGSKGHQAMRIVRFMLEIQREKLASNKVLPPSEIIPMIYKALEESIEVLHQGTFQDLEMWEEVLRRETMSFLKKEFGDECLLLGNYCPI